jgi:hypothetical protein
MASWNMAGVMWSIIMFFIGGVPVGIAWIQGKAAKRLTRLSGERALVSRDWIIDVTRVGLFVMRLVLGSRIEERLVGVVSLLCLFWGEAVIKIDSSATLYFLTSMSRSAEPYLL